MVSLYPRHTLRIAMELKIPLGLPLGSPISLFSLSVVERVSGTLVVPWPCYGSEALHLIYLSPDSLGWLTDSSLILASIRLSVFSRHPVLLFCNLHYLAILGLQSKSVLGECNYKCIFCTQGYLFSPSQLCI